MSFYFLVLGLFKSVVRSFTEELELCPGMLDPGNAILSVCQNVGQDDANQKCELQLVNFGSCPSVV